MGSRSQPRLNIFTVGNMRVMICLGQGGLRSLSASSFLLVYAVVDEKSVTNNTYMALRYSNVIHNALL